MTAEDEFGKLELDSTDKLIKESLDDYIQYFETDIFKPEIRNKLNDYFDKIPDIYHGDLLKKLEICKYSGKLDNMPDLLERLKTMLENYKKLDQIKKVAEDNKSRIDAHNLVVKERMVRRKAKRKERIEAARKEQAEGFKAEQDFADRTGIELPKISDVSLVNNNPSNEEWANYYKDKVTTDITPDQLIGTINSSFGPNCGPAQDLHNCIGVGKKGRAKEIIKIIRDKKGLSRFGGSSKRYKTRKNMNKNKKKSLKRRKRNLKH